MVAEAWSAVIDGENIGVYEDFFSLAGIHCWPCALWPGCEALLTWTSTPGLLENPTVTRLAENIEGAHCTAPKTSVGPDVVDREELVL